MTVRWTSLDSSVIPAAAPGVMDAFSRLTQLEEGLFNVGTGFRASGRSLLWRRIIPIEDGRLESRQLGMGGDELAVESVNPHLAVVGAPLHSRSDEPRRHRVTN